MKRIFSILLLFCSFMIHSKSNSYEFLLAKYLENDLNLQKYKMEADIAKERLSIHQLSNLVNLTVGLGATSSLWFGSSDSAIDFTPSMSLEFPEWRNTRFSFEVPTTTPWGGSSEKFDMQPELSVATDIYPFKKKPTSYDVGKLTLEREVTQANRTLQMHIYTVEQEFLALLTQVFQATYNITQARLDESDARRELDLAKLDGYGENSLEYKRLSLAVNKKKWTVKERERFYQTALSRLSRECGYEVTDLPDNLPDVVLVDITKLQLKDYKEYEQAIWSKEKSDLQREVDRESFQLAGIGGYRYGSSDARVYEDKSHYVQAGVEASYNGFSTMVAVDMPVQNISKPELVVKMSWTPISIFTNAMYEKVRAIEDNVEDVDISIIEKNFKVKCDALLEERETLVWQKDLYELEENLYRQQANEYQRNYDAGYINISEYDRGNVEYQNSVVQTLLGKINRMVFASEVSNLFVHDKPITETVSGISIERLLELVDKESNNEDK